MGFGVGEFVLLRVDDGVLADDVFDPFEDVGEVAFIGGAVGGVDSEFEPEGLVLDYLVLQ